jgi:RNA polymerase sigma-70 factor (ECF subfamily)
MKTDDSFADFYRAEAPVVYGFFIRLGASFDDAADATGHAFAEAYARWETIQQPRAYVRKAGQNYLARMVGRRTTDIERTFRACWYTESIQDVYAQPEVGQVLSLLKTLPEKQRVVMAWFYDGFTVAEIAKLIDMKVPTVESNLRHARNALKAMGVGQRHD